MTWEKRIPKFTFYLQKTRGNPVFWLSKDSWNTMNSSGNERVEIKIEETPMRSIAIRDDYLGAIHNRKSNQIEIYRLDKKDYPLPINRDRYSVIENIELTEDVSRIIVEASTCDNENLRDFLSKHVLLVKSNPGKDHWLESIPPEVSTLLSIKRC